MRRFSSLLVVGILSLVGCKMQTSDSRLQEDVFVFDQSEQENSQTAPLVVERKNAEGEITGYLTRQFDESGNYALSTNGNFMYGQPPADTSTKTLETWAESQRQLSWNTRNYNPTQSGGVFIPTTANYGTQQVSPPKYVKVGGVLHERSEKGSSFDLIGGNFPKDDFGYNYRPAPGNTKVAPKDWRETNLFFDRQLNGRYANELRSGFRPK